MNPAQFIAELSRQGVQVDVEGEQLVCRGPAGGLSAEMAQRLASHKAALKAHLGGGIRYPAPSAGASETHPGRGPAWGTAGRTGLGGPGGGPALGADRL